MLGVQCKRLTFDTEITGITDKPQDVRNGYVFVCIEGNSFDGHKSAHEALSKGCAAVICTKDINISRQITVTNARMAFSQMLANFYKEKLRQIKLIGITGTNGKTSTSIFLRHILERAGEKTGLIGTLGIEYSGTIYETNMTTPRQDILFHRLACMVEDGCGSCVMEVSSQALSQERCASLLFETAVFTNLARDHLDYHKSQEEYAAAKAKLFAQCKQAVLNADDAAAEYMAKNCRGDKLFYSATGKKARLSAKELLFGQNVTEYTLELDGSKHRVNIPAIGMFTVYNSLAAIGAAYMGGVPIEQACSSLSDAVPAPGRAERLILNKPFAVYIDYAHTPAAMTGILTSLRAIIQGKLITVFGCGGDRDREKRPLMGEAASRYSDVIILTDDNPRTEDPDIIIRDIKYGIKNNIVIIDRDRREAIGLALSLAQEGDAVLVAGKGHEKYQLIGGEKLPFSDKETIYSMLKEKI